jgi:hypothetical protein
LPSRNHTWSWILLTLKLSMKLGRVSVAMIIRNGRGECVLADQADAWNPDWCFFFPHSFQENRETLNGLLL